MQCRENPKMADLSDKYYTIKSLANTEFVPIDLQKIFHKPKRNCSYEIDKLRPYKVF